MPTCRDTFGGFALIQRCQVHKGRNIIERLDPSLHAGVKKVLMAHELLLRREVPLRAAKRRAGMCEEPRLSLRTAIAALHLLPRVLPNTGLAGYTPPSGVVISYDMPVRLVAEHGQPPPLAEFTARREDSR